MKCNFKIRKQQQESEAIGKKYDDYINVGIILASVALNLEFGFGEKRIEQLNRRITEIINTEFKGGAERFSKEMDYNVQHGMEKLHKAYKQIMNIKE